jgi:hypothetical protein
MVTIRRVPQLLEAKSYRYGKEHQSWFSVATFLIKAVVIVAKKQEYGDRDNANQFNPGSLHLGTNKVLDEDGL